MDPTEHISFGYRDPHANDLIKTLPGALDRVRLLTLLARAYARSEDPDRANETIKAAQRITLNQRQNEHYPPSAARIVEAANFQDRHGIGLGIAVAPCQRRVLTPRLCQRRDRSLPASPAGCAHRRRLQSDVRQRRAG